MHPCAHAGIQRCLWAPDGLGVLVIAQFTIRATLWSLTQRRHVKCQHIKHISSSILSMTRA